MEWRFLHTLEGHRVNCRRLRVRLTGSVLKIQISDHRWHATTRNKGNLQQGSLDGGDDTCMLRLNEMDDVLREAALAMEWCLLHDPIIKKGSWHKMDVREKREIKRSLIIITCWRGVVRIKIVSSPQMVIKSAPPRCPDFERWHLCDSGGWFRTGSSQNLMFYTKCCLFRARKFCEVPKAF